MGIDRAAFHRHQVGTFNNQRHDAPQAMRSAPPQLLRIDNPAACLAMALLLGSAVFPAASAQPPHVDPSEGSTQALLPPRTAANMATASLGATLAQVTPALVSVGNLALRACRTHPLACGGLVGTTVAGGLLGAAMLHKAPAAAPVAGADAPLSPPGTTPSASKATPHCGASCPHEHQHPVDPTQDQLQREIADTTLPDGTPLSPALAHAASECGDSLQCLADRINSIIAQLPRTTVAQLQAMVAHARMPASPTAANGWPPGVDAHPVLSPWEPLVDALVSMYTPQVAALQADLERIVAPTAQRSGDPMFNWQQANAERMRTIAALFQEAGCAVERLSFPLGAELAELLEREHGSNLLARFPDATADADAPRLLLVAHGDMIGLSRGSDGAYDNGAGVATLLHVARQLRADASSLGCRVELLITGDEETGLVGSRGHATRCLQDDSCPAFVVNIDLVGRGGLGYALSDSAALAAQPRLRGAAAGTPLPTSAIEAESSALLQSVFAERGFQRWAQAPAVISSDHLSFQNVSIPAIGLSQLSQEEARQWRLLDDAKQRWLDAYTAALSGHPGRDPQSFSAYMAANRQMENYFALRDAHPLAPPAMIHNERDRLHRIDPRMAVQFGDALLAFVRRWSSLHALDSSASTTTTEA